MVIQGRSFWYQLILTYILSRTVSKLSLIIGQVFAFDRGLPLFTTLIWGEPITRDNEVWPQETRHVALSYGAKCVSIS